MSIHSAVFPVQSEGTCKAQLLDRFSPAEFSKSDEFAKIAAEISVFVSWVNSLHPEG